MTHILEALPGRNPRSADLARALQLDRKLSWRISRLTQCIDPFSTVEHIPGASGIEKFVVAAGKLNIDDRLLKEARDAYAEFERMIDMHAGDRASLEVMARSFVADSSDDVLLANRREAFNGNSSIWGVQARTQLSVNIVGPSDNPDRVDIALISGLIDLRRLRPKVTWVVARLGFVGSDGITYPATASETLENGGSAHAQDVRIPMIEPFCSQPLPALRPVVRESGDIEVELLDGPVGDTGAVTCTLSGGLFRSAGSRYRTDKDPVANLNVHVRTPCTMLVHDLLVHNELFGRLKPASSLYSEIHREVRSGTKRDERFRLPGQPRVDYVGRGASSVRTTDVPHYPELIRFVLEKLGWDETAFDVYRLNMKYPPMPAAATMTFDLLER